jgi:hypothetical protein
MIRFVFSSTNALERFFTMSINTLSLNRFSPQQSRSNPKVTQQREGVLMDGSIMKDEILKKCSIEAYARGFTKAQTEKLCKAVIAQLLKPLSKNTSDPFLLEGITENDSLLFSTLLGEKNSETRQHQKKIMSRGALFFDRWINFGFKLQYGITPHRAIHAYDGMDVTKTKIKLSVPLFPKIAHFEEHGLRNPGEELILFNHPQTPSQYIDMEQFFKGLGKDILRAIRWYETHVHTDNVERIQSHYLDMFGQKIEGLDSTRKLLGPTSLEDRIQDLK